MNDTWSDIKGKAKHLLAGFLFISFVIGGCGAAFSLFAAGISSLQNVDTKYQQPVVVVSPQPVEPAEPSTPNYPVQSQTPFTVPQPDEPLSHMHSPIGDAMDNGGVYVGTRIQEAFGSMLKGVITTLFLEQNDAPQQGGIPYGRTSG